MNIFVVIDLLLLLTVYNDKLLVICTPWDQYVYSVSDNCLDTALLNNKWAKPSDLKDLSDLDKRSLLAISLNKVRE